MKSKWIFDTVLTKNCIVLSYYLKRWINKNRNINFLHNKDRKIEKLGRKKKDKENFMTEKEKMIQGILYHSADETLQKERLEAKQAIFAINQMPPEKIGKRNEKMKQLFAKIGSNSYIEPPFYCDYGYNIEIGESFYANHNCIFLDCAKITIGNYVMLGPNVNLYTATHPLDAKLRRKSLEQAYPITIEDDVWIGGNVTILPGVTIGKNSVIGAGSVVTKSIPANCLAYGNPCKVQKTLEEKNTNRQ